MRADDLPPPPLTKGTDVPNFDIRLTRGDSYSLKVRWKDEDGLPITPTAARMQVRSTTSAETTQLALALGSGLEVDGDGYVVISISPAQSAGLTGGVYDLELTSATATQTVISGAFVVEPDVTR